MRAKWGGGLRESEVWGGEACMRAKWGGGLHESEVWGGRPA